MLGKRVSYNNPLGPLVSIILLVLLFLSMFYIAKAVFWVLSVLAPILLIATLVIDHTVVVNYGKWVINQVKRNPVFGIGLILLTIFGFPVVSSFLFGKALFKRKIKTVRNDFETKRNGELIEFEELDSEPLQLDELPRRTRPRPEPQMRPQNRPQAKPRNDYEDLFDE